MARVLFLFNHDQFHQVAHSLPIALQLRAAGRHDVVLAASTQQMAEHVETLVREAGQSVPVERLSLHRATSKALANSLDTVVPARKLLLYRDNIELFRSFDALVTSEKTSLLLKSRYGLTDLRMIHTRHGAGDRAIGFGREAREFDLTLVSGEKIARRLVAEANVDPAKLAIVGYSKFDLHGDNRIANPFPDPDRPIVLYAPHPSPRLSSYYRFGPEVLRRFAASERYNLVFAPHVMLFERSRVVTISPPAIARVPQVPAEAIEASNILVDRGSPASSDMSYTNLADIYLGDASSQIYEFLYRPRPVVHLDAHQTHWHGDPNHAHWNAGPVCTDPARILETVDEAIATHADFLPTQRQMVEDTFSISGEPSSRRAAQAIENFLEKEGLG